MKELRMLAGIVLVGLVLLAVLIFAGWHLMSKVEPDAARAWALVATILLPITGIGCYRLGHTEARGTLKGLDVGVSKVMSAANQAADVKASATRKVRQATAEQPNVVVLPPPEPAFSIRPQLEAGEVVELE